MVTPFPQGQPEVQGYKTQGTSARMAGAQLAYPENVVLAAARARRLQNGQFWFPAGAVSPA
jgi:hypothetical protein